MALIGGLCLFLFGMNAMSGIAVAHSLFNIACTAILLPMSGLLEKLAVRLVPDDKKPVEFAELDERLLATPPLALERCRQLTAEMADLAVKGLKKGIASLQGYTPELAASIRNLERTSDHCSNVAGCVLDMAQNNLNIHQSLRAARTEDPQFAWRFADYAAKYALPAAE